MERAVFEKKEQFNFIANRIKGFREFPPMFHPHCELMYVVSGEIRMTIDGMEKILKKGDISFVFPYSVHSYDDAPNTEVIILLFEASEVKLFESDLFGKKPIYPYTDKVSHLLPVFEKMVCYYKEYGGDENMKKKIIAAYLSVALGELFMVMPLQDAVFDSPDITKQILSYCSEHFADDDISIKKVADALYVSSSYVSKVFCNKLKYNFREYINMLRIDKSKELLEKSGMKILDIMLECGFKNQSSFNRIFSEDTGLSPRVYRQKHS